MKEIQEKLYKHVDGSSSSSKRTEKVLMKSEIKVQSDSEIQSDSLNESFNNSFQPPLTQLFDSLEFLKLNQLKNENLMGNKSSDDFDTADDFEHAVDDFKEVTQKNKSQTKTKQNIKSSNKKDLREICQECGIMLSSKIALKNHFDCKHDKVKRYFCDLCNYGGTIKYHLKCHMKSHISDDIRRIHKCNHCDFISVSKGSLKVHEIAEHSGIIHTCHCGREFNHKVGKNF